MAVPFPPPTMRAWQYSSTKGGLERNLKINPSAPVPVPKPNQNLVQVIATALNPVDYKPAEVPLVGRFIISKPATPGLDFAGRIVTPASNSSFKKGDLVFGLSGSTPFEGKGALREFTCSEKENCVAVPEGVDPVDAAIVGVAGLSAYQSIVQRVKKGDKIFINGGSGGCGTFGIQIAKTVGCHVTTTCSTPNVALCKSLGADEVVDYRKSNVLEALKASGTKFDHVVDNVGGDLTLYWGCHEFTKPDAVYVMVGHSPSPGNLGNSIKARVLPGFLGGGQRKKEGFWPKLRKEDLEQIGKWMKEGKVKAVIDSRFPFEQVPQAFEKLKTGRAKGKVVVDVAPISGS
jgi:NADPH:quinone reductase-like Zn-dependent oxidoreductase